jgi:hypothetical protein
VSGLLLLRGFAVLVSPELKDDGVAERLTRAHEQMAHATREELTKLRCAGLSC